MPHRLIVAFLLASLFGPRGGAAEPEVAAGANPAWGWIVEQRHAEARDAFTAQIAAGGEAAREGRLGLAVALLGLQPKTQGNVNRARELLTPLAESAPVDDLALQARYFLARIAALHDREADLDLARRHYRSLFAEHPQAPLAQIAAVKYVLLAVNAVVDASAMRNALAELEALAPLFTYAPARRDYHALMATAYLRHAPDELATARAHSLAAEEAGYADAERRVSNLLRIAELSRALGDSATARIYYERFLAAASRDTRVLLVRERLAALP